MAQTSEAPPASLKAETGSPGGVNEGQAARLPVKAPVRGLSPWRGDRGMLAMIAGLLGLLILVWLIGRAVFPEACPPALVPPSGGVAAGSHIPKGGEPPPFPSLPLQLGA